jgi:hypothetical protein
MRFALWKPLLNSLCVALPPLLVERCCLHASLCADLPPKVCAPSFLSVCFYTLLQRLRVCAMPGTN